MASARKFYHLLKETVTGFSEDNCPRLGAALAFYIMLSLSPLLLVVIGMAGLAYGNNAAARGEVVQQTKQLVGKDGADAVETTLDSTKSQTGGIVSTVIGVVTAVIGATGVFAQLQSSLNVVWQVETTGKKKDEDESILRTVWDIVRKRLLSFSMVCGMALLLLVSLAINAVINAMQGMIARHLGTTPLLVHVVDIATSVLLATLLFAMIFKILPARKITWRTVGLGAFVTAILFTVGKTLIAIYLGKAAPGSAFGAAGSLVVLLIWIYFSTQILLLGAEFTKVYARHYGGMPALDPDG
jgi:membrane protein